MNRRIHLLLVTALIGLATLLGGCGGSKSLADKTAQQLFTSGKDHYDRGKYFRSIQYFQTIVYNYPGDPIIDTAQYYLALAYFGNKDYELAGTEFDRLVLNYPASPFFEHALFMKAVSYFESTPRHYGLDQTELTSAIQQFEDFIIDFPESEVLPDVRTYLLLARTRMARKIYDAGAVYSYMNALEAAKIYLQKVIDEYSDTEYGVQAAYKYAEMELKLGNFEEAHRRYRDFKIVYPGHELVAKATEMAVKAAFKSAEQAFKGGYYVLAAERFSTFQETYPDNGQSEKAGDYLDEIREINRQQTATNESGS